MAMRARVGHGPPVNMNHHHLDDHVTHLNQQRPPAPLPATGTTGIHNNQFLTSARNPDTNLRVKHEALADFDGFVDRRRNSHPNPQLPPNVNLTIPGLSDVRPMSNSNNNPPHLNHSNRSSYPPRGGIGGHGHGAQDDRFRSEISNLPSRAQPARERDQMDGHLGGHVAASGVVGRANNPNNPGGYNANHNPNFQQQRVQSAGPLRANHHNNMSHLNNRPPSSFQRQDQGGYPIPRQTNNQVGNGPGVDNIQHRNRRNNEASNIFGGRSEEEVPYIYIYICIMHNAYNNTYTYTRTLCLYVSPVISEYEHDIVNPPIAPINLITL